jgi:hypothetical protein
VSRTYDAGMSMQPPPPPPPVDGPPYGGGSPYGGGYGGYGGYEHPQGTTVLVLGILSLVVCQFLGPVAWVMGNTAIAEIDRNPSAYSNRGSVQAGRICGIISSVLLILTVVVLLFVLIAAVTASST